ncbi:MAG: DNA polymerase Y family protein [Aureliella sp.]
MRDARRGMLVAAANLRAREGGVRPLMRMSEASALVESVVYPLDTDEDIESLCHLAEAATRFSPIVGLEQLDAKPWASRTLPWPESILLDVTGIGRFFGSEDNLGQQIAQWLRQQHLFGCIAIADNIATAWALANFALRRPDAGTSTPDNKRDSYDKTDSTSQKTDNESDEADTDEAVYADLPPSRYLIAPPGESRHSSEQLPIAAMRLQKETVESLGKLGVQTISQLSQLPRSGLASRLGKQLLVRWDQLLGEKVEPIVALQSEAQWSLDHNLEHPITDSEMILAHVNQLCRELTARLAARGKGALRTVCRLEMAESPSLVMQLGLFRPSNDSAHLEMLLSGQLEQHLRQQPVRDVTCLSLTATLVSDLMWRQGELFDSSGADNRQKIASLVDSLSGRLGRKNVLSAKTNREAQPELAYQLTPMTGRRNDGSEQNSGRKLSSRLARRRAEPSREDPLRRPTHLFGPVEITLRTIDVPAPGGSGDANKKTQFLYAGQWHTIIERLGPERLESGWWRGPSCRRDYYRLVSSDGSWWWVFRDMTNNSWFLHGKFD